MKKIINFRIRDKLKKNRLRHYRSISLYIVIAYTSLVFFRYGMIRPAIFALKSNIEIPYNYLKSFLLRRSIDLDIKHKNVISLDEKEGKLNR